MKKLLLLLLLAAPAGAAYYQPGLNPSVSNLTVASTASVTHFYSSSTRTGGAGTGAAVEDFNHHLYIYGVQTDPQDLWGGFWIDGDYDDQARTYVSTDVGHGGPFFDRGRDHTHNSHFSFAGEFNQLCTSTSPFANCMSEIVHTKWDSRGLTAAQVGSNMPTIAGITSRIDVTSDTFGSAALSTGTVVDFYAAVGALGGFPGRRFLFLNDFDVDKQILTVGNIIKASTVSAQAVLGAGTFDPVAKHVLGGVSFITSTATITMAASTFPAPTATYGSYAINAWFALCNANLGAGVTIAIPNGGTVFNKGAATVTLSALNSTASCAAWVGTTGGVWFQMW